MVDHRGEAPSLGRPCPAREPLPPGGAVAQRSSRVGRRADALDGYTGRRFKVGVSAVVEPVESHSSRASRPNSGASGILLRGSGSVLGGREPLNVAVARLVSRGTERGRPGVTKQGLPAPATAPTRATPVKDGSSTRSADERPGPGRCSVRGTRGLVPTRKRQADSRRTSRTTVDRQRATEEASPLLHADETGATLTQGVRQGRFDVESVPIVGDRSLH